MARALIVYFKSELHYNHSRRIYIAATTKTRASEISGKPTGHFDKQICRQFPAGAPEVPPFITSEGVWMEIRDLDREGHYECDTWGARGCRKDGDRVPTNEAAFIRCATLEACRETFTLMVDQALKARGIPREDL